MSTKNYRAIKKYSELLPLVEQVIASGRPFGFDLESGYDGPPRPKVSLHAHDLGSKIVGISFSADTRWAVYVPLSHDSGDNIDRQVDVCRLFWRLLNTGLGVAHNIKFEFQHLSRWFRELLGDDLSVGAAVTAARGYFPFRSDTMVEAYVDATEESYGLKALTRSVFNHDQADLLSLFPGLAKNKSDTLRFNSLDLTPEVTAYACEDAAWCLALHEKFFPLVKDNWIFRIEMQILPILCQMEDTGVRFDWAAMAITHAEATEFLAQLDNEIQVRLSQMVGEEVTVNLGSPKQLQDILYGRLGMRTTRRSKTTGQPSTDAIALERLSKDYAVVRQILDWKEIRKLLGSYLEKYPKDFNFAADGMAHPNHLQTAVKSGRFAVSDPAYQQLPKTKTYTLSNGTAFSYNFRDFVICPPEHYLLGFDYSQVELRMLAGESGEPTLLRAFENDEDVHTATASLMFGVPREEVTKDLRSKGKTLNFGLLYGLTAKSLAERLAISEDEAQDLYDQYFGAFSSIAVWMERVTAAGVDAGYAMTRFGRKVLIPELGHAEKFMREKGERLCVNAPIQGAAADYMKTAMVRAHAALRQAGLLDRVKLCMNIHDALEFYVHESLDPAEVIAVLAPAVVYPIPGLPKIVADWHIGLRWGSLLELDVRPEGLFAKVKDQRLPITPDWLSKLAGGQFEERKQASSGAEVVAQLVAQPEAEVEPEGPASPGHLTIALSEMPTPIGWRGMKDLIDARPGDNSIEFRTPQGAVTYQKRTSLGPKDSSRIRLTLGADAEVTYTEMESV